MLSLMEEPLMLITVNLVTMMATNLKMPLILVQRSTVMFKELLKTLFSLETCLLMLLMT
jgi:hypothetical protein